METKQTNVVRKYSQLLEDWWPWLMIDPRGMRFEMVDPRDKLEPVDDRPKRQVRTRNQVVW